MRGGVRWLYCLILIAWTVGVPAAFSQQNNFGGILIDAQGVIRMAGRIRNDSNGAAPVLPKTPSGDMNTAVPLRCVSLSRLVAACLSSWEAGNQLPEGAAGLAGLTAVERVILLPNESDLLLLGPAEGFVRHANGRLLGKYSGRPVIHFEDLRTLCRSLPTSRTVGVSFDPDSTRLARAQQAIRSMRGAVTPAVAQARFETIAGILGTWDISTFGVPADSGTALALVQADFMLKRLALGLDNPRVRGFRNCLQLAAAGDNMMRRWWLAPYYPELTISNEGTRLYLSGPRMQLVAQEELVAFDGRRSDAPFNRISTQRYAKQFNEHLPELTEAVPPLADTQNLFDLCLVIEFWRLAAEQGNMPSPAEFWPEESLPRRSVYHVPREVESQLAVKTAGRGLKIAMIGGGVSIHPGSLLDQATESAENEAPPAVPADVWWWDVPSVEK